MRLTEADLVRALMSDGSTEVQKVPCLVCGLRLLVEQARVDWVHDIARGSSCGRSEMDLRHKIHLLWVRLEADKAWPGTTLS